MAKRTAATELNHDNWDKEDETEEAGTFLKASEEEMKKRVMKKAKRRNLTDEAKKSVFASFSFASNGSATTNGAAANAFSFLNTAKTNGTTSGKDDTSKLNGSNTDEEKKPSVPFAGFAFGGPKKEDSAKPFGGFAFGGSKPSDDTAASKPFGGFAFGGAKPSASDSIKPFGGFEFGAAKEKNEDNSDNKDEVKRNGDAVEENKDKDDQTTDSSTQSIESEKEKGSSETAEDKKEDEPKEVEAKVEPPKNDLMSLFKKASGNWTCDICMISNPADKAKCAACECPKPGAAPAAPPAPTASLMPAAAGNDLFQKFKPASGNWTCDICMISNAADKDSCAACESPKPGGGKPAPSASSTSSNSFSFGSSGGFKFVTGDAAKTENSGGGFSLAAQSSSTTNQSGGFKFGAQPATTEASGQNGGFKFGETPKESTENAGGFKFGAQPSEAKEQNGGFKFGAQPSETKEQNGGFKFGVQPSETKEQNGGFKFGAQPSETKDQNGDIKLDGQTSENTNETEGFKIDGQSTEMKMERGGFKLENQASAPGGFKFGEDSGSQKQNGFKFGSDSGSVATTPIGKNVIAKSVSGGTPGTPSRKAQYLGHIKQLNIQVSSWVEKHINENPLVDLGPVFEDYANHMSNLKRKFGVEKKSVKSAEKSCEETKRGRLES